MTDPKPCEHKFKHLRSEGTEKVGYRKWNQVDLFYCEKCLEQQRVSKPVLEKKSYSW